MSEEQKKELPPASVEDADALAGLLDQALGEFKPSSTSAPVRCTDDDLDEMMEQHDRAAAQRAAKEFQAMLAQMVQVQEEALCKQTEGKPEDDGLDEEGRAMMAAMRQLMECSGQVAEAGNADEFMRGLDQLRSPDSPMEPFMVMIMQTLASKEVMYEPLKQIRDGYPAYLESEGDKLPADELERFKKQQEVIGKICAEFESQPDAPPPTEAEMDQAAPAPDMTQFETLGKLLVELQSYGYPPQELAGNLPDGWSFDQASGLPRVDNVESAAEACTIM